MHPDSGKTEQEMLGRNTALRSVKREEHQQGALLVNWKQKHTNGKNVCDDEDDGGLCEKRDRLWRDDNTEDDVFTSETTEA